MFRIISKCFHRQIDYPEPLLVLRIISKCFHRQIDYPGPLLSLLTENSTDLPRKPHSCGNKGIQGLSIRDVNNQNGPRT